MWSSSGLLHFEQQLLGKVSFGGSGLGAGPSGVSLVITDTSQERIRIISG